MDLTKIKRWHTSGTCDTPEMKTELCVPSDRGRNRKHNLNISKVVSKRNRRVRNQGKETSDRMIERLSAKADRTAQRKADRATARAQRKERKAWLKEFNRTA